MTTTTTPAEHVQAKQIAAIRDYLDHAEERDRIKRRLNTAECAVNNARTRVETACVPAGVKHNEAVLLWVDGILYRLRRSEHYAVIVEVVKDA